MTQDALVDFRALSELDDTLPSQVYGTTHTLGENLS